MNEMPCGLRQWLKYTDPVEWALVWRRAVYMMQHYKQRFCVVWLEDYKIMEIMSEVAFDETAQNEYLVSMTPAPLMAEGPRQQGF